MSKKTPPAKQAPAPAPEKETLFEQLYFYFFLVLPVVYSTKTVDPVLVPRQLLLAVFVLLLCIILLYRVSTKKTDPDFSFLRLGSSWLTGLFLLTVLISFFQSDVLSESTYTFSKMLLEALFFFLTTFLIIRQQLRIKALVKSLVGMGTIILLIALYQLFTLDLTQGSFSDNTYNIKSSMAHRNLFASLLFLVFPFLFLAMTTKGALKTVSIILVITGTGMLWIIQSRAALVALIASAIVYGILTLRYRLVSLGKKSLRNVIAAGVVLLFAVVGITYQFRNTFSHLFYTESVYERVALWENTASIIQEHPLTGVGAGNWQIHFPENGLDKFDVARVKDGLTTFQRPHNDFLWVFSETGLFGIITYAAVFACILFYLIRIIRNSTDRSEKRRSAILFAAITGYILIALLDFPLERIEHQLVLYLLFAIATGTYFQQLPPSGKLLTKVPLYLAFAGALFSLVVAFQRNTGEVHMQQLYGAHQTGNWNEMIVEADLATNSCYQIDPTSVPIAWYKGVAFFSLGDLAQAQRQFELANKIHPYNIHVMNNLASCYEKQQQHGKAIRYYQRALHYSSGFEEARLNLSAVYYNTQAYEKAFQTIDRCDTASTDPKYATFLPAILAKKAELSLKGQTDPLLTHRLNTLKGNNELLVNAYLSAKRKKVPFGIFLLQSN